MTLFTWQCNESRAQISRRPHDAFFKKNINDVAQQPTLLHCPVPWCP